MDVPLSSRNILLLGGSSKFTTTLPVSSSIPIGLLVWSGVDCVLFVVCDHDQRLVFAWILDLSKPRYHLGKEHPSGAAIQR